MNPRLLFVFLCFLPTLFLPAQTDFREGFLVTNGGDTLRGEIDYRGDVFLTTTCRFRRDGQKASDYPPQDIQSYRFVDSRYFVSKTVDEKPVFLECLFTGAVNIYALSRSAPENDRFFIEKEEVRLTEIPYEEGVRRVPVEDAPNKLNTKVNYQSKEHIGVLSFFMQDAPELIPSIQSMQKPRSRTLVKLAQSYHQAVSGESQSISYVKDVPFLKIMPEVVGGVISFSDIPNITEKSYTHFGLIGHLWIPNASEKLFLRTGVLLSKLDIEGVSETYVKIPIQLEYIYPGDLIQPRLAYGPNYYVPDGQSTVSLNLGANIRMYNNLFLSASTDIEFNPNLIVIPKRMIGYSLMAGVFWRIP